MSLNFSYYEIERLVMNEVQKTNEVYEFFYMTPLELSNFSYAFMSILANQPDTKEEFVKKIVDKLHARKQNNELWVRVP